jgi:hypothetical protein
VQQLGVTSAAFLPQQQQPQLQAASSRSFHASRAAFDSNQVRGAAAVGQPWPGLGLNVYCQPPLATWHRTVASAT